MTQRFVITGCGRSGTTYIAQLLSQLGCHCTHEKLFDGRQPSRLKVWLARMGLQSLPWPDSICGEAAWEVAPLLPLLPDNIQVFHQVRHPLEYIRSRQKKGWVHGRFRGRYLPHLPRHRRSTFAAMSLAGQADLLARFWIDWNALVERRVGNKPYLRYRIEDFGLQQLLEMLDLIDFPYEAEQVSEVFASLPTNINTRGEKREDITLDLLPDSTRQDLERAAARYGYTL